MEVVLTKEEHFNSEQLTRNISMFGEEGLQKIRQAFVIVVGLGGVGKCVVFQLVFFLPQRR